VVPGCARRAVIDDLDQDAVRHADDNDGDGPAIDTGLGVLDGFGDDFRSQ